MRHTHASRPRPVARTIVCPGCKEPSNVLETIGGIVICISCAEKLKAKVEHTKAVRRAATANRPAVREAFRNDNRRKR